MAHIENEMRVTLASHSSNEAVARSVVTAFIMQMDPSVGELADIKTAVSEAVTNAIVHGYRNSSGNVEILCRILERDVLYIRVRDKGCGIPDVKKAMEPLFTTRGGACGAWLCGHGKLYGQRFRQKRSGKGDKRYYEKAHPFRKSYTCRS